MQITLVDFMSLDGVVQGPGGPKEDTDGGFAHGGWSHRYFDPEVMGPLVGELMESAPTRCCSDAAPGRRWLPPGPSAPAIRTPTA